MNGPRPMDVTPFWATQNSSHALKSRDQRKLRKEQTKQKRAQTAGPTRQSKAVSETGDQSSSSSETAPVVETKETTRPDAVEELKTTTETKSDTKEPQAPSDPSALEIPLAKLKIKDLNDEDRECVEYVRAANAAFEHVYLCVARASKKWHQIALGRYNRFGGGDQGRGFVVITVTDIDRLLKNGPDRDAVSYVTYAKALKQVMEAESDPTKLQVQLTPEMNNLIKTYDPSKDFVLQVMMVLIPVQDQKQASGKDAKKNADPATIVSAEAWKQNSPKFISKCFLMRHNTEDTYNDDLQKALRQARKAKQTSKPQPMDTGKEEGKGDKTPVSGATKAGDK